MSQENSNQNRMKILVKMLQNFCWHQWILWCPPRNHLGFSGRVCPVKANVQFTVVYTPSNCPREACLWQAFSPKFPLSTEGETCNEVSCRQKTLLNWKKVCTTVSTKIMNYCTLWEMPQMSMTNQQHLELYFYCKWNPIKNCLHFTSATLVTLRREGNLS
jgi:hypothetical protein